VRTAQTFAAYQRNAADNDKLKKEKRNRKIKEEKASVVM